MSDVLNDCPACGRLETGGWVCEGSQGCETAPERLDLSTELGWNPKPDIRCESCGGWMHFDEGILIYRCYNDCC